MANIEENVNLEDQQVLNPMEIPLILERIFSFLGENQLDACRQVSKLWNLHSLSAWRSTARVMLTPGQRGSNLSKLMDFVKLQEYRNSGKPFSRFWVTGSGTASRFWPTCGPNIKILKLYGITFRSVDDFRGVIFKHCSNVRDLILEDVIVLRKRVDPQLKKAVEYQPNTSLKSLGITGCSSFLGVSWTELLSNFPQLLDLSVSFSSARDLDYQSLFESAKEIRDLNSKSLNLKRISVSDESSIKDYNWNGLIRFLMETGLKLEKMSLVIGLNDGRNSVWDIARAHAETLKTLNFSPHDVIPPREIPSPSCLSLLPNGLYENIEELVLEDCAFTSVKFLKYTPNLKMLYISLLEGNNPIRNTMYSDMRGVQLTKCFTLSISNAVFVTAKEIRKLSVWLPNVQRLLLDKPDNAAFTAVCSSWPQLSRLDLSDCSVNDCGFTGFDEQTVSRINDGLQVNLEMINRLPNLTSFPGLRRISLWGPMSDDFDATLGRCAAIHAFQALRNLECLDLFGYEVSPEELWEPILRVNYPSWMY